MNKHLSEVIAMLYRASTNGVRRAFALSRAEAERLPPLPWVAIVSITAPERPPAMLDGFVHMLRLSFADVDFMSFAPSPRARAKLGHAFTIEQAQAIRHFVETLPGGVTSVVVHCEGGYSRSCAVVLALHHLYGYEVELSKLAQANPSVLQLMMHVVYPERRRRGGRA
ncbi:protein-tyrosine phosphatase family protein [Cupriavidus basilensis]